MDRNLEEQIKEFRVKTEQFAKGEISVKDYKGFSGKFGSYAQKGAEAAMLRLRMSGGRLSKEGLKAIIGLCDKYEIKRLHCTTCQTIQLHDLPFDKVADIMTEAIENGFYTLGGGGDFPRNVMASPLTGVEKGENFDVYPYAEKAALYLKEQIERVKMPRKLKVCFSNSPANAVHATFRDLGFVSRPDGKFDVYCAGGMGKNPRMGVKVSEGIDGTKILYCIKAMISLFCEYGNYENRSKARTRYMQDTLGEELADKFGEKLALALEEGGLDINPEPEEIKKSGREKTADSKRVIEQKQPGLYAVKFHPIGGILTPDILKGLYNAIRDLDEVSLRVSPDETIYIVNCAGDELDAVLSATEGGAKKDIEESVSCIGATVCQQGLRDSQGLLRDILAAVEPYDFPADALPLIHISGCLSSCGTHQIGKIGFHGKVKLVDKKPVPGFTIQINGCDAQGAEKFGDDIGVMATEDIPKFIVELGKTVADAGMSYDEFAAGKSDVLRQIVDKYI